MGTLVARVDLDALVDRALDARHRLTEQGLHEEAAVIELLVEEIVDAPSTKATAFHTVSEAARLIGVSEVRIKDWIARGILKSYRLGGRVIIPRSAVDGYRSVAEAAQAIEPLPDREELIDMIREGRRRVPWLEQR